MAALRVMPQRAVRRFWAAEQSLRHFSLSTVPPVDGEFPEAEYLLLEDFVRYDHVRGWRNSTVGATTCPWLTKARPLSFHTQRQDAQPPGGDYRRRREVRPRIIRGCTRFASLTLTAPRLACVGAQHRVGHSRLPEPEWSVYEGPQAHDV